MMGELQSIGGKANYNEKEKTDQRRWGWTATKRLEKSWVPRIVGGGKGGTIPRTRGGPAEGDNRRRRAGEEGRGFQWTTSVKTGVSG